jgi:hypothetical protein
VAPGGEVRRVAEHAVRPPDHEVREPGLDLAAAARAAVRLLGGRGPARLHVPAAAAADLLTGARLARTQVRGTVVARSVAPGHDLYQYQLFACEWPQAPQGLPYRPVMYERPHWICTR